MKKGIAIGTDDFTKLRDKNSYFVDKSLFIKDIIDSDDEVALISRPRRFGKTLNMTMFKAYFEKTEHSNRTLFEDLAIWQQGDRYTSEQGKYPVIFMSLKEVKGSTWEDCIDKIRGLIIKEFSKHEYIANTLNNTDTQIFNNICNDTAKNRDFEQSINYLTKWLEQYHNKKVILLIDEYDAPIQEGYVRGYYNEVIEFMRNFFSAAMKTNPSLHKAVLTGITRIAGESLFSGLNNFNNYSILEKKYSTYFGFTEQEVVETCNYFDKKWEIEEIKKWYNGYSFGGNVIYNPWSILCAMDTLEDELDAYWVNTASDTLIRNEMAKKPIRIKEELLKLLNGEKLTKEIMKEITYGDISKADDAVWSFLLYAGYLKAENIRIDINGEKIGELSIPNQEVKLLFKKIVRTWLTTTLGGKPEIGFMLEAMINGNTEEFEKYLKIFVKNSFSYFDVTADEPENTYHAYILGLLVNLEHTYYIDSNRESGYGRSDVMIMPKMGEKSNVAVILEFKKSKTDDDEALENIANVALEQIKTKDYITEAKKRGATEIFCYGIGFAGKKLKIVMVKSVDE